ncbi:hypothetical protein H4Q26_007974 [Puccinia striiformis f. sp. tritici PST-130]|nr:hypothetical protein H4Q26_007974 [Puccinia striiformis f. sp. tritici PST-130]
MLQYAMLGLAKTLKTGEHLEELQSAKRKLTAEEERKMREDVNVVVEGPKCIMEDITDREKLKQSVQYECNFIGFSSSKNIWLARDVLIKQGFKKALFQVDSLGVKTRSTRDFCVLDGTSTTVYRCGPKIDLLVTKPEPPSTGNCNLSTFNQLFLILKQSNWLEFSIPCGNPLSKMKHYRDRCIFNCPKVWPLDFRPVEDKERKTAAELNHDLETKSLTQIGQALLIATSTEGEPTEDCTMTSPNTWSNQKIETGQTGRLSLKQGFIFRDDRKLSTTTTTTAPGEEKNCSTGWTFILLNVRESRTILLSDSTTPVLTYNHDTDATAIGPVPQNFDFTNQATLTGPAYVATPLSLILVIIILHLLMMLDDSVEVFKDVMNKFHQACITRSNGELYDIVKANPHSKKFLSDDEVGLWGIGIGKRGQNCLKTSTSLQV